jgi:hypothetical protein
LWGETSTATSQEQGSTQTDKAQNIFKTNDRHNFNPAALLRKCILGHARKSDKSKSNGSKLSAQRGRFSKTFLFCAKKATCISPPRDYYVRLPNQLQTNMYI